MSFLPKSFSLPNPVATSMTTLRSHTDIDWQPVFREYGNSGNRRLSDTDMYATFKTTIGSGQKVNKSLYLRIGRAIIAELGWEEGEALLLCYDKADVFNMMLIKNDKGYKMGREKGTPMHAVTVKTPFISCQPFKGVPVSYEVDKKEKRLYFRINPTTTG